MIKKLNKILMVNPFGIGDVLFTTPVMGVLKGVYPDLKIHYICNRRVQPLLDCHELIESVQVYERDEWVALWKKNPFKYWQRMLAEIESLKQAQYEAVFDFSMNAGFGFLTKSAGIAYRIGYDYKNRGRFLTHSRPLQGFESKHVIEYYLDLVRDLGITIKSPRMSITIPKEQQDWAKLQRQQWLTHQYDRCVFLAPGGGASWGADAHEKRWPKANYERLVVSMLEKWPIRIVLLGGPGDRTICDQLATQHKSVINMCAQTSLLELAALCQQSDLVIANDGGPLHMAVAAGAKTLSLFGPVDQHVYGPYPMREHDVVVRDMACRPCYRQFRKTSCEHHSCLKNLTPDIVLEKVAACLFCDFSQ